MEDVEEGVRKFKTEFVEGDIPSNEIIGKIIETGGKINELGLTPEGTGNISLRTEKGMLITIGGKNKGELKKDDVVEVVDFNFSIAKVVGGQKPSSETPMHWLIYHSYPMANAVIHVHDMDAVSQSSKLLVALGVHSTKVKTEYGTQDQAFEVIDALEHAQYAIIQDHGIICMGQTLDEALELVLKVNEKVRPVA